MKTIGILMIVAINLTLPIVFAPQINGMHQIPDNGAGWLEGTGWIYDDGGRVALGAHAALEDDIPGDFYAIGDLRVGDIITVVGDAGAVSYRVTDTRAVSRWDTSWIQRGDGPATLTLITCVADDDWRFVVNGTRIDGTG